MKAQDSHKKQIEMEEEILQKRASQREKFQSVDDLSDAVRKGSLSAEKAAEIEHSSDANSAEKQAQQKSVAPEVTPKAKSVDITASMNPMERLLRDDTKDSAVNKKVRNAL